MRSCESFVRSSRRRCAPLLSLRSSAGYSEEVFVDTPCRGQGIAPRVLAALIEAVDGTGQQSLVMVRAWSPHWNAVSEIEIHRLQTRLVPKLEHIGLHHFREGLYWRHTSLSTPEERGEPLSS